MPTISIIVFAAVVVLLGAYWWSRRQSHAAEDDSEIMLIRATLTPRMYAAYAKHRAELLNIIKEPLVVDTEESIFSDSVVCRRQLRAQPTSENEEKCKSEFAILQQLHTELEFNHPEHPELKEVHERIGNVREAIFILEHGTPREIRKLLGDAKALGWDL